MYFSGRDWQTNQNRGKDERRDVQRDPGCEPEDQDLRLGRRFNFQQDNDQKHTAEVTKTWLQDESVKGPDSNPIEHLWKDVKAAVERRSPSKLAELQRICGEEQGKTLQMQMCQACIDTPKKTEAGVTAKAAGSSKY